MNKLVFLSLIIIPFCSKSQDLKQNEYYNQYKKGVQLVANNEFEKATFILNPLLSRKYKFSVTPFAYYYQALAQQKLKKSFESRIILRQLHEQFPDWQKNDDAYYLYADANFSDGYYEEGLKQLNKIVSNQFNDDIFNLTNHYFNNLGLKELKYYNRQNPNSSGIALALINKIYLNSTSKEDLVLSDKLINSFNLGKYINAETKIKKPTTDPIIQKNTDNGINFGLFLPFNLNQILDAKNIKTNKYIFDFYDGMLLARDKLINEKIFVNLYTFDIERNENNISNLLNSQNIKNLDLAIGPLYLETNEIASNFFNKNQITQIHPFSNNLSLVKNNQTHLAQPSFETQSLKIIDFLQSQNQIKTAAVYFGQSKKDSTFAYIYRDYLLNAGYSIVDFNKFTKLETLKINQKIGHIFVVGSDGIGNKIANYLEQKKILNCLIGSSASFDKTIPTNSTKNIYIVSNDYFESNNEFIVEFKKEYFAKRNTLPNIYMMQGYDLMLFFGRAYAKFGKNYQLAFETQTISNGLLLSGYNFKTSKIDNQLVPIIKYNGGIVYK